MAEGWRKVDELSVDLALAVWVTDGVVGGRPVGDPRVRVQGVDEQPVRNPSGYHLFFDLPAETVTVAVDGGDRYVDATTSVELDPAASDTHDPGEAVAVTLEPTPSYPFPSGLTRVRGTLRKAGAPVADAEVTVTNVPGTTRTTRTTDAGEYAYYFDDVDPGDVVVDSSTGDRLFRPGGADPEFEVDGPHGQFRTSVRVVVGERTTRDLSY